MYKKIRKKVASTVSGFEKSEDFAWGKWLKAPPLEQHSIENFDISLLETNQYNSWLEKPSFQEMKFGFREIYIFPEHENLRPKKSKTHAVFFGLPKSQVTKLKLFDNEFNFDNKSTKIEFTSFGHKLKEVNWKVPDTEIKLISWELKPNISKNNLLNMENFSADNHSAKESKIEFKEVKHAPKIYKVKITDLDKIKLTKIYFLKNINLHNVQIMRESLSLFDKPATQSEDLKYVLTQESTEHEVPVQKHIERKEPHEEKDLIRENSLDALNEIIDKSVEERMSEILSDNITDEKIINTEISFEAIIDEEIEIDIPDNSVFHDTEEIITDQVGEKLADDEPESQEVNTVAEDKYGDDEGESGEPEPEATEEGAGSEYEPEFQYLYNFQKDGAKFLLANKHAVLYDEMGLGKSIQVVSALNYMLKEKIKNAVVVCDPMESGTRGKIPGDADGWLGHFHQRAGDLKIETAKATPQARKKQWMSLPDVLIITYDAFISDFEGIISGSKELKKNACFIFDEAQDLFEHKKFDKQKFSALFDFKYLWFTTSYPKEYLKEKFDKDFKGKISDNNYLGRKRSEVKHELPSFTWQNKWLTLDDDQVEEYKEAFTSAKEKVQWFLESGNPLRFNANVFTLIHQLKQGYNFSEKKGKSRKTKMLVDQVNFIAKNQQKVVIFSQYEKAGTKKIEEVLKQNNIKFLSCAPGLSTKDMETVLKKFSSSPAITALVVGVKPSRIKIPSDNISYIIHFDLWWNPASLWQTEEALVSSSKMDGEKQSLCVYSYLMKDTIEEKINVLLNSKGFLNKHIMETVNPDSITEMITNPEWLDIFNMPDDDYKQRYQKGLLETEKRIDNYSQSEFIERSKNFFAKLGYKNLDVFENKNSNTFDIRGIYKKAKYDQQMCARFLMKSSVSRDEVKVHIAELKEITHNGKYFLVTKGVFEGEEVIKSDESLIDRNRLANYFYQFIIV